MELTTNKLFFSFSAIVLAGFLIFFTVTMIIIHNSVSSHCTSFMDEYGGDCVEASISALNSDNKTIREKNTAIYVLGQLADKRALPHLKSIYRGVPDHKEPLDEVISQYEIRKAIKWCEDGNLTHFMYKRLVD